MIKNCPICGDEGVYHLHSEMPDSHICGCIDPDCIAHQLAYDFNSKEAAVAAWNTRAAIDRVTVARHLAPAAWEEIDARRKKWQDPDHVAKYEAAMKGRGLVPSNWEKLYERLAGPSLKRADDLIAILGGAPAA